MAGFNLGESEPTDTMGVTHAYQMLRIRFRRRTGLRVSAVLGSEDGCIRETENAGYFLDILDAEIFL